MDDVPAAQLEPVLTGRIQAEAATPGIFDALRPGPAEDCLDI